MDLSYDYDRVGNITELANAAEVNSPNMMGGKTSFSYQYDDLYRLTDSTGTFDTKPDKQHAYTLSMQYDTIHNIEQKTQLHTLRQPGGQKITQQKTSYDWAYQYDGQQPHAPTHLGDRTFSYDANGNQLGWTHDKNGTRRTITWDEENRIQNIQDNGHTFTYAYDGSGQRMTKRGPQGETGYINQWMTLRNGEIGTKHVFVGTTRVVSKLVKQDKPNSKRNSENNTDNNGKGKARIVYEKDQYYFHPDHLGTTAYITHTNGQVYQHLEYFPFGETWIEEHSNKQRTPYLFTGKELDEETGLYYFGARYYDPRMSVWMSTDPALEKFLPTSSKEVTMRSPSPTGVRVYANLPGMGGVYSSQNVSMYSYSHLNPVVYSDADGLWSTEAHNYFIDAFAKEHGLNESATAAVKQGSKHADSLKYQFGDSAHMHAMSDGKSTPEVQIEKMNKFISGKMSEYRTLLDRAESASSQGGGRSGSPASRLRKQAYRALGEALHPAMDSTSPAHEGWQIWEWNKETVTRHGDFEGSLENLDAARSPAKLDSTLDAMNKAFSGEEL